MKIILPPQHSYVKVLNIRGANQFRKQSVILKISNTGNEDTFELVDNQLVSVDHDASFEISVLDLFGLFISALFGNKKVKLREQA